MCHYAYGTNAERTSAREKSNPSMTGNLLIQPMSEERIIMSMQIPKQKKKLYTNYSACLVEEYKVKTRKRQYIFVNIISKKIFKICNNLEL